MGYKASVVVYGIARCPYCKSASKELAVPITPEADMPEEHRLLLGDFKTVPKIFIDDEFVGGYDDLVADAVLKKEKPDKCVKRAYDNDYSCFTNAEILAIAAEYNKLLSPSDRKRNRIAVEGKSPDEVYGEIQARMLGCGKSEKCWIRKVGFPPEVKARLEAAFPPPMPAEWKTAPDAWLTNHDIDRVMRGYEKLAPAFAFLGVHSIDFRHKKKASGACVGGGLCKFELPAPEISRAAAVFNTDTHEKNGSHWIALMFCADPGDKAYGVYFYDPLGKRPGYEINEFATVIVEKLKLRHGGAPPPAYEYNQLKNQKGNNECGMFCVYCIYRFVTTELSFRDICKTMGDDYKMQRERQRFFDPSPAARDK